MDASITLWIAFNAAILVLLAVDLGIVQRRPHAIGAREAALWTAFWIGLSLAFALGLYLFVGREPALEFLAGYLIEKSLSVDNIFIFVLIFTSFSVPAKYQHRVLFWGILGALVMRGAMIGVGVYLIRRFEWVIYIFGGFLLLTGIRAALHRAREETQLEDRFALRAVRRVLPVTPEYHEQHFFVRRDGRLHATPLLLVLVLVESTDLVFALDSIPAVFAVTRDPFLVYSSNVLAILGLRALYFLLADTIERFRYIRHGLAAILVFVGAKMILTDIVHIPTLLSLGVVAAILGFTGFLSYLHRDRPRD